MNTKIIDHFNKGQTPWNKGKKTGISPNKGKIMSQKQKEKISLSLKKRYKEGMIHWAQGSKGELTAWNKGKRDKSVQGLIDGIEKLLESNFSNMQELNKTLRKLRLFNAEGSHSLAEWEALKMKYRYMCLCCKKVEPEITLSKDHIVPLSRGGDNDISNIQPLCLSCNSRKNNKTKRYD